MAMADTFLDTNVLVYLFDDDPIKADVAEKILEIGATISVQVLNEFTRTARRKMKRPWSDVHHMLTAIRANCVVTPVSLAVHERGLAYAERYRLQIFDAMLVAAAVLAGCKTLYSEDMHHGLIIDGLTIRNPYAVA